MAEQGDRVYLVTRGIYSDERAAGIYPSLDRAQAQFPDAAWHRAPFDDQCWTADAAVVGRWASGKPIIDAVTIYEMIFNQDILGMGQ